MVYVWSQTVSNVWIPQIVPYVKILMGLRQTLNARNALLTVTHALMVNVLAAFKPFY